MKTLAFTMTVLLCVTQSHGCSNGHGTPTSVNGLTQGLSRDEGAETLAPEAGAPCAASLRVCSFNIQFLGNPKNRDDHAVASVLADCDVALVQELVAPPVDVIYPDGDTDSADPEAAAFFDEMEALGFEYVLSEEDTGTGDTLHTAGTATEWWVTFYKPDSVVPADDLPHGFLAEDRSNHPSYERVPYAVGLRTIGGQFDFVVINVHLKPGASGKARRKEELAAIAAWVDANDDSEHDFIIIGDMNIENAAELADATPQGFVSLNDEVRATNTNVNGPKPYDHAMYRPAHSPEVDADEGLDVLDLIALMQPQWSGPETYPGDPYDHNRFRARYSDHHPISFVLTAATDDDGTGVPPTEVAPDAGTPTPDAGADVPSPLVDLNTATVVELQTLPGIGPAKATAIIADRNTNGPFESVDDLVRVRGIGAATLDGLRELVTAD